METNINILLAYVYDTVGNFSELITALTAIVSTVNITNKNHIIALKISTSSILLIHSTNGITSTLIDSWHDIIDNEGKQYNPLKNILGEENYNNFDSTANVISLPGDAKKLYEIVKNKNFSNIDWDSIVTDEFEQNKLIDTLDNLGLMLDIKTINELRGSGNENKQNN